VASPPTEGKTTPPTVPPAVPAEPKSSEQPVSEDEQIETCIIQLRALGLIRENQRKRSVHDKGTYWTLTLYGDQRMVQLRAHRKGAHARDRGGRKAEVAEEEAT
jgi:hypothetical protein